MRETRLGADGRLVGVVGLGAMGMSYAYDPRDRDDANSVRVVREALDLGVTLVDTADVYGPFTNEELVGRALGARRDEAVLATKGGVRHVGDDVVLDGRPEHLRSAVEASLRRLQTDRVDLYFLHRVDPAVPVEDSWGELASAVGAGKARHLGLSEPTLDQLVRAHRVHPVAAVQSELSLFTRDHLADVVPYCAAQGITFVAHSAVGSGLLTGRFQSRGDLDPRDERITMSRFTNEALLANRRLVDVVAAVARRHGATPAQVALAWVLARGDHVVALGGTTSSVHLRENAAAADLIINDGDKALLDLLPPPAGARA